MTIEPEMLMAYADGELDPLTAKRVERAMAEDPALAEQVARHRRLRDRIAQPYAPIADEPVPERLAALLRPQGVPLPARAAHPGRMVSTAWRSVAAMAACLVVGVVLGQRIDRGPVQATDHGLYASGPLARALEGQASGTAGLVRVAVSFRDRQNGYCRIFASTAADGIACRDDRGWALRRTMPGSQAGSGQGYAQAGSSDAELMAAAQEMMADMPLDAEGERAAIAAGWRKR